LIKIPQHEIYEKRYSQSGNLNEFLNLNEVELYSSQVILVIVLFKKGAIFLICPRQSQCTPRRPQLVIFNREKNTNTGMFFLYCSRQMKVTDEYAN